MEKALILIGGGGHCRSVIDVVERAGYNILGILDVPEAVGKEVLPGYNVIGTDDDIGNYIDKAKFLITVGFIKDSTNRIKLYNKIKEANGELATIIASTANVSKYATIGKGTIVMHNATVNAGAKIGNSVIINTFANIEHDTFIGNQCHISTDAMINGNCHIGNNVFIGSQSVINNGIIIGDDIIIGSGTVVRKSIIEKGIYSGGTQIIKI